MMARFTSATGSGQTLCHDAWKCVIPLPLTSIDHGNMATPCIVPTTLMLLQAVIEGYKQIHSWDKRKHKNTRLRSSDPRS